MSVDIDWSKLDAELANHVKQFLNKHFQAITKPSFIGDVEVTDFQWGSEAPQLEIINITDPFPEFYEQVETDDTNVSHVVDKEPNDNTNNNNNNNLVMSSQTSTSNMSLQSPTMAPTEYFSEDSYSNINRFSPQLSQQQRFNFMHSFHRSPFVAPQHPFNTQSPSFYFSSSLVMPTSSPIWDSVNEEDWIDDEDINHVSNSSTSVSQHIPSPSKTEMDFQVHMLISYKGDMSLTVMTELRMNYPSMMFMSLPINLRVCSIEFEATAVVAYIQSMSRVCVSMLEPEENTLPINSRGKDVGMDSLLRNVQIETIVGDEQKQVLKNVGKIEKFVVDQLRKILDDELVFPSYQLIQLN
ncbi:uncharacterized protein BX663DRAFT_562355 [Cokeromyces recurvatus]|uniref:uncharacterized protein n=1 Tax=Cokeromyces recurvatus TaxID=90255 RepID=UPI0022206962|nr:uncharacterized protein BX663DRAFT_562355 [Cokeromyces recurvatus]KAI7901456.1 hypothetical protein BX663DRAFT_562355 [Cokeromyces recurvatus]